MVIYYFQPPDGSCIHQLPLQTHDLRSQWLIHLRSPKDSLKNGHVEVKLVVLMIFTTFYIAQYCFFGGERVSFPTTTGGELPGIFPRGNERNGPQPSAESLAPKGWNDSSLGQCGANVGPDPCLSALGWVHGQAGPMGGKQLGDQFYHTFLGSTKTA